MEKIDKLGFMALLKNHGIWTDAKNQDIAIEAPGQLELMDTEIAEIALENLDLISAGLIRCKINDSSFAKCDFSAAMFIDSRFENCKFTNCTFIKADFRSVIARGCEFIECDFIKADFSKSDFSGCNLSGSNLNWAFMIKADFRNVDWSKAHLKGAKVTSAKLFNSRKFFLEEGESMEGSSIDLSEQGDGSMLVGEGALSRIFTWKS